jgi:hypothetical protein
MVMRIQRRLRAVVLSSCVVAVVVGCQSKASDRAEGGLSLLSPDPRTAIEAHYREGDHLLVLRSKLERAGVTSEILDENGHSITGLASSIVARNQGRTPQGALAIPIPALLANSAKLGTALRMSKHGLRQLREAIGADAADAPVFKHLAHQTGVLRKALRDTRMVLLQEWASEARRHIAMTPEEHASFFAILNRQAVALAGKSSPKGRATAAATSFDAEVEALLGPERYAQYQTRRRAWLAPAGQDALEVVQ